MSDNAKRELGRPLLPSTPKRDKKRADRARQTHNTVMELEKAINLLKKAHLEAYNERMALQAAYKANPSYPLFQELEKACTKEKNLYVKLNPQYATREDKKDFNKIEKQDKHWTIDECQQYLRLKRDGVGCFLRRNSIKADGYLNDGRNRALFNKEKIIKAREAELKHASSQQHYK